MTIDNYGWMIMIVGILIIPPFAGTHHIRFLSTKDFQDLGDLQDE